MTEQLTNIKLQSLYSELEGQKLRLERQMQALHKFICKYHQITGIEPISGLAVSNLPVYYSNRDSVYIDKLIENKPGSQLDSFELSLVPCLNPRTGILSSLDQVDAFLQVVGSARTVYQKMLVIKTIENIREPYILNKLYHKELMKHLNGWLTRCREQDSEISLTKGLLVCLKNIFEIPKTVNKVLKMNKREISPLAKEIKEKWINLLKKDTKADAKSATKESEKTPSVESAPEKTPAVESAPEKKPAVETTTEQKDKKEEQTSPSATENSAVASAPEKKEDTEGTKLEMEEPISRPRKSRKRLVAFKPDNELEEVFIIEDFDYHPGKSFSSSVKDELNSEASVFKNKRRRLEEEGTTPTTTTPTTTPTAPTTTPTTTPATTTPTATTPTPTTPVQSNFPQYPPSSTPQARPAPSYDNFIHPPYPPQFITYIRTYEGLFRSKLGKFSTTTLPVAPSLGPASGKRVTAQDVEQALRIIDGMKYNRGNY